MGVATIYIGGAMRDAQTNLSIPFQSAAARLLICAVLMLLVKPLPERKSGDAGAQIQTPAG